MDETGTKVLETRDDVNALIESLEKAAYAAAAQDLLESAYKAQIQAEQDLAPPMTALLRARKQSIQQQRRLAIIVTVFPHGVKCWLIWVSMRNITLCPIL